MATCPQCAQTYRGMSACHCAGCHQSFTSGSGFDRHRRGDACVDPAAVGMTRRLRGGHAYWSMPGPAPDARERLRPQDLRA